MQDNLKSMLDHVLFSEEEITKKTKELALEITKDYKDENVDLVLIGVLKGAAIFLSELAKNIDLDFELDFMSVSSYGNNTYSSGEVKILKDLDENIEGKNVIIVEDIVDTGYTLKYLFENLKQRNPKSVKVCSLLTKPSRRAVDIEPDYVGFEIPDEFVVGYGMDFKQKLRNMPLVGTLKEEYYKK